MVGINFLQIMSNPFEHLTPDEQRAMVARSSSGEHPIFAGEEAGVIQSDNRHMVLHGQFFEVEPEQLLDVAKHLASSGDSPSKVIEKAYALICEAHLTTRNIRHWNEKTRRNHVKKDIYEIVEGLVIREGPDKGKVSRAQVVSAFLVSKGLRTNETDDRKLFNKWMNDDLRLRSYKSVIPWNPTAKDFDQNLNETLHAKGWIRWFQDGSTGYLLLPEETEEPHTKSRRKLRDGEHVTRPWWETKNVWWPSPSQKEISELKRRYFVDKGKHFRTDYVATKALEKFDQWLDLQKKIESRAEPPKKKTKRDSDTGQFD